MFDRMCEEKEDRQILRQAMQYIQYTYGKREPAQIASSQCRLYESLYNLNGGFNIFLLLMLNDLVIGLFIFVIKFFRRKI